MLKRTSPDPIRRPRSIRARLAAFVKRLSVGQKVMTVIFFEVLSYSMVTTIAISQIHSVGNEVRHMADLYLPLFSTTETIRQSIQEGRLNLKDVIFVGGRVVYDRDAEETYLAARARYQDANREIREQLRWAEELIEKALANESENDSLILEYSQPLLDQLARIRQANRVQTNRVEKIFQHVEDGSFLMGMEMLDDVAASEAALTSELDQLVILLERVKQESVAYATRVEDYASRYTMIASLVMVSIVIVVVFMIIRRNISRPLHLMTDVISSFDATKEAIETPNERALLARGDELGKVSNSFHRLKVALRARDQALQAAKEEAERANRSKSLFLASASHDLRQPLHAMQMYTAALRHMVRNQDALAIVKDIEAVSVSTSRLLNALLDISRLEAGAVKPHFQAVPVQEVFRRIARAYRPEAYRKNLSMRFVSTSHWVRSDPDLLERIVGNFVSNAIRYTDKGEVLIGCRRQGNRVAIEVWDTGSGIPESELPAVFEEFHQLRNKERDRSKGLGLGLAIVKRLAACLGHTVESESKVGRGSRFAILAQSAKRSSLELVDPLQAANASAGLRGLKVLVLENDLDVLRATTSLLELWECSVTPVSDFGAAMTAFANQPDVDVVIADYRLPGDIDGLKAIGRLREQADREIPAIVITGDVEGIDPSGLKESGIWIMHKPLRPAKMRALLMSLELDSIGTEDRSYASAPLKIDELL